MNSNRHEGWWSAMLIALLVMGLSSSLLAESATPAGAADDGNGAATADPDGEVPNVGDEPVGRGRLYVDSPDFMSEAWFDKYKKPVDWFAWTADLRLRWAYTNNSGLGGSVVDRQPLHEWHYNRYRARAAATVIPHESFRFNIRLVWEGWYFFEPDPFPGGGDQWQPRDAPLDRLNVVVDKPADLPLKLTVGRQDVILGGAPGAGGGWLVLDGTPLDGSRTIFLDAARVDWTIEACQTVMSFIYIEQKSAPDAWLTPINNEDRPLTEQDERGAIVWFDNKSLVPEHVVSGYFIYKHGERVLANGYNADLYTVGTHWAGPLAENLTYVFDIAAQFGNKDSQDVAAMGFLGEVQWLVDEPTKARVRFGYEYLSGDDPDTTGTNEGFDILWGRWARFSDLIAYRYIPESRIGDFTNMHRLELGYRFYPREDLELCTSYHLMLADENPARNVPGFSQEGVIRGHLVTAKAIYKLNSHLEAHLLGELFFPGNYYTSNANEMASFLRAELFLTF